MKYQVLEHFPGHGPAEDPEEYDNCLDALDDLYDAAMAEWKEYGCSRAAPEWQHVIDEINDAILRAKSGGDGSLAVKTPNGTVWRVEAAHE